MLPNRLRAACAIADTGFQLAMVLSTAGKLLVGTNVLAMKVSGKMTMKLALLNTSGVRTSIPMIAISQDIANANSSSSR